MSRPAYPSVLDRFVVVLVQPQLLTNIGACVRAMKNMGLTRLRLVAPKPELDPAVIERVAHRTGDIVDAIETFEDLDGAIEDCHRVVGLTARDRSRAWPVSAPRERMPELVELASDAQLAFVFGREDHGLDNASIERCDELMTIPTRADYASLNLAQAVLVTSYELFLAARQASATGPASATESEQRELATAGARGRLLAQILHTLEAIRFFKSAARSGVEHALARVISRARLDPRETRMLTGIFTETLKFAHRVRRGIIPADLAEASVPEVDAAHVAAIEPPARSADAEE